jgi:hypothetical protein
MKILLKIDYFLLNSFTSMAEILDDFPHLRVSQCSLERTMGMGQEGVNCNATRANRVIGGSDPSPRLGTKLNSDFQCIPLLSC